MSRLLLFISCMVVGFNSCQDIDDGIRPLVGVYRAHVVGLAGPFDLIISTDRGDDVIIEALFDGVDWYTVVADIDTFEDERIIDINMRDQDISSNLEIKGSGFFLDDNIELRYILKEGGNRRELTLVGTKY